MKSQVIKLEISIDNSKFKKQLKKLKWNLFWLKIKVWIYKKIELLKK